MIEFISGLVIGAICGVILGGVVMYADGLKRQLEEKQGKK